VLFRDRIKKLRN